MQGKDTSLRTLLKGHFTLRYSSKVAPERSLSVTHMIGSWHEFVVHGGCDVCRTVYRSKQRTAAVLADGITVQSTHPPSVLDTIAPHWGHFLHPSRAMASWKSFSATAAALKSLVCCTTWHVTPACISTGCPELPCQQYVLYMYTYAYWWELYICSFLECQKCSMFYLTIMTPVYR